MLLYQLFRSRNMKVKKMRLFIIATFLVIIAVVLVLCFGYYSDDKKAKVDGTLVLNDTVGRVIF